MTASALAAPLPAAAQSQLLYEVRGGVLAHDVAIVAANHYENGISFNGEIAFAPSLPLFGGAIRPALGGTFTTNNATSLVYLDAKWEWAWPSFFIGIGVGPAIQTGQLHVSQNNQKALGSRVLFHVPLEVGWQMTPNYRLSLYYEHVSNAFLAYPNPGMDNIGGRIAYRF